MITRNFDDLAEFIFRLQTKQFGDAQGRTEGLLNHIVKEVEEARKNPEDLMEWVDIILLAVDGYRRNGGDSAALYDFIMTKCEIVSRRQYPDPLTTPVDEPLEHDRSVSDNG